VSSSRRGSQSRRRAEDVVVRPAEPHGSTGANGQSPKRPLKLQRHTRGGQP
jgi:hypothetical protein